MDIQLHNTTKIVFLNGVPARIWEGMTSSGIPVFAYITRIGVEKNENLTEFEIELEATRAPSVEMESIPLRLLI